MISLFKKIEVFNKLAHLTITAKSTLLVKLAQESSDEIEDIVGSIKSDFFASKIIGTEHDEGIEGAYNEIIYFVNSSLERFKPIDEKIKAADAEIAKIKEQIALQGEDAKTTPLYAKQAELRKEIQNLSGKQINLVKFKEELNELTSDFFTQVNDLTSMISSNDEKILNALKEEMRIGDEGDYLSSDKLKTLIKLMTKNVLALLNKINTSLNMNLIDAEDAALTSSVSQIASSFKEFEQKGDVVREKFNEDLENNKVKKLTDEEKLKHRSFMKSLQSLTKRRDLKKRIEEVDKKIKQAEQDGNEFSLEYYIKEKIKLEMRYATTGRTGSQSQKEQSKRRSNQLKSKDENIVGIVNGYNNYIGMTKDKLKKQKFDEYLKEPNFLINTFPDLTDMYSRMLEYNSVLQKETDKKIIKSTKENIKKMEEEFKARIKYLKSTTEQTVIDFNNEFESRLGIYRELCYDIKEFLGKKGLDKIENDQIIIDKLLSSSDNIKASSIKIGVLLSKANDLKQKANSSGLTNGLVPHIMSIEERLKEFKEILDNAIKNESLE